MSNKIKLKITVDILMTGILLFLMPYELVGRAAHEWLGAAMFILFVLHHILNGSWMKNLFKGKYTFLRTVQTLLVILVLVSMLGSMTSGILISRHVFAFLDIKGAAAFGRSLHMTCAYWGFVWMSLHLGFHWGMILGMAGKMFKKPSAVWKWFTGILAFGIAGYGIYAFIKREIGSYMLMRMQFVFFDFEEPLVFFILDYMAVMGFFIFIGHYICKYIKVRGNKTRHKNNQ